MKGKLKLSVIDDYIKIIVIKNLFNNSFSNTIINCKEKFISTKMLDNRLEEAYIKLINKLKLNNNSFLILKKELEENNSLFLFAKENDFLNLEYVLDMANRDLNEIMDNLNSKLKMLKVCL